VAHAVSLTPHASSCYIGRVRVGFSVLVVKLRSVYTRQAHQLDTCTADRNNTTEIMPSCAMSSTREYSA